MLQKFIDDNTNYIDLLKKYNLSFKKYDNLNLLLIKYKYNSKYDYDKYPWIRYCKGAIINLNDNKVIIIPPIKSIKIDSIDGLDDNLVIEELFDGVMVNLFYFNDEWMMSTRGSIGGNNKWNSDLSFKEMVDDCHIDCDNLDKSSTYSFLLKHIKNQTVYPVYKNEMILVEKNNQPVDSIHKYDIKNIFDKIDNIKGYTFKDLNKNIRYSWINPEYIKIKNLNYNTNNLKEKFIYLYRKNQLKEYYNYYPNDIPALNKIKFDYLNFIKNIHQLYLYNYVFKNKTEYPKNYNDLINEIHLYHKSNKKNIYKNEINIILNNYPIQLLIKLF